MQRHELESRWEGNQGRENPPKTPKLWERGTAPPLNGRMVRKKNRGNSLKMGGGVQHRRGDTKKQTRQTSAHTKKV